ncbi:MAG: 30S ribosomal protein S9 [Candidatus Firestonebacteria bacterium]
MAESKNKKNRFIAVGRRKTAIAKVGLAEGDGSITVNGQDIKKYFPRLSLQFQVKKPLELLGLADKMTVWSSCNGGGKTAQAEALMLGIARALIIVNAEYRLLLSKNGLMERDPRMVERKKYGQAGARKRFQFSKR